MNPEDLSIEELQKILQKKLEAENTKEETNKSVSDDFSVSRTDSNSRRQAVVAKENTWEDVGEHEDVSTPDFTPTARRRPKAKKVKKRCHVCGKTFEISSSLVSGEFVRCNDCVK
jgi:hypothetical protein